MRHFYRILATFFIGVMCANIFAQTYTITFTGKDSTNQYHIPLNHVTVFNLDQLWEEVLYYPDTTLILGTVGIDDYTFIPDMQLMQNVPNPFDGTTEFALVLPEDRDVLLEIYDITGRLAVGQHFPALSAGTHLFQATLTSPQTYLLSAKVDNGQMTIKMVNEGHGMGNTIRHLGMTDANGDFTVYLKDDKAYNNFPFSAGDEMKYTGYAWIDEVLKESKTLLQRQYNSETVTLQFKVTVPTVITEQPTNINATGTSYGGNVTSSGGSLVTERGVCWGTTPNPTIASESHAENGSGLGSFSGNLIGLTSGVTYYVRAYATNGIGTAYGAEKSFTTLSLPVVTTDQVTDITGTTAVCGGNVVSEGGTWVTSRGICWSTSPVPTVNDSHTLENSIGGFTSNMTGLIEGTTYYVRAYATNSVGTSYGEQRVFTTCTLPSVTTNTVSDLSSTSATCGGNVTDTGGSIVTERGVCWNTSPNPTANGNHTIDGSGAGDFTSSIDGLAAGTTYYVRAYATNIVGTSYGEQRSFTTYDFPTVTTNTVSGLSSTSATCGGNVTATGGTTVTVRGVCWSTSQNPTVNDSHTTNGSGSGSFTSSITGLTAGTTYYIRAYATNSVGTSYGEQLTFTTHSLPTVTTNTVSDLTSTTATCGGNVTATGGTTVTARGVCWSTSQSPTISDNHTTNGSGIGSFTSNMTGLTAGTTYYVRAYATNSVGTSYGAQRSFTTYSLPTVTTNTVSNLSSTSATCGGNVTATGGTTVTVRGVCWSTSQNPTVNDSHTTNGSGSGSFTSSITGLTAGTTYYVRAYATNSVGTSYGAQRTFTTYSLPTVTTNTVSDLTSTTATCGGNVTATGGTTVTARGVCWSTSPNPTVNDSHTTNGSGAGSFISNITGLSAGTTYYVRAYATNSVGTSYGAQRTFTTYSLPTVTTNMVSDLTSTTATCGGNVTATGGTTITARGVCWNTSQNPTVNDSHTTNGSGTGNFTSNITGLTAGTTYYVRAYATNSVGTAYGTQRSFTTRSLPTVTTNIATTISSTSAICGGNVTSEGVSAVTARGVCWSTSHNPTIANAHTTDSVGTGDFSSNLTGLTLGSTYYVRAYATNSAGTAYGEEVSFTLYLVVPKSGTDYYNMTTGNITVYDHAGPDANYENNCNGNLIITAPNDKLLLVSGTYNTENNFDKLYIYDGEGTSNQLVVLTGNDGSISSPIITTQNTLTLRFNSDVSVTRSGFELLVTAVPKNEVPTLTTEMVSNITDSSAICGGNVTANNGMEITARGVCWGSSHNPTVNGNHTTDGAGTGTFTSNLTGLGANSTYYVRAYATCQYGTFYGNEVSFKTSFTTISNAQPCPGSHTISDIDGNVYNTVQIGSQCWMAENLRATRYSDGTSIELGTDTSSTTAYRYNPSNNVNNVSTYGYLYNWFAVMHGSVSSDSIPSGVQGVCPTGWHVPSDAEWTQLTDYVSASGYSCNSSNNIAKALAGNTGWYSSSNDCAVGNELSSNNATGFNAMPAGYRYGSGYRYFYMYAFFWSSTEISNGNVWNRNLYSDYAHIGRSSSSKYYGYSVRCLRDGNPTTAIPTVTTSSVSNITENSVTCGGHVAAGSGTAVTARGVCWSTSPNPTLADSTTSNGSGTGNFTSNLTNLYPYQLYYVRAYATTAYGTVYGNEVTFTINLNPNGDSLSCPGMPQVTDIDGNVYNTVQIGGQCWMRDNLRTTKYADGLSINQGGYSSTIAYWYYPNNDASSKPTHGLLYNWPAVMHGSASSAATPSGVQGICPDGWHMPSDEEWTLLTNYVSNQSGYVCGNDNSNIAKALAANTGWFGNSSYYYNVCYVGDALENNNATGFSALPASYYDSYNGNYYSIGYNTYFWSATQNNGNVAYNRNLYYSHTYVSRNTNSKYYGCSVRCLYDGEQAQYFPTVTTSNVSNLASTTATCGGEITATNGVQVTARGVCWNLSQNPTINDSHTTDGSGIGSFTSNITGLSSNQTYYVRAYATNQYGTVYGNEVRFTIAVNPNGDSFSCPGTPIVTDVDGNVYNTVQIGAQCWMRENLRTTKYEDGTSITYDDYSMGYNLESWCYPNGDSLNKHNYGLLYNWKAVMHDASSSDATPSGVQGICPNGWHVPSNAEWDQLVDYVSSRSDFLCANNNTYIGKALSANLGWNSSTASCAVGNNLAENNATRFSALPAGMLHNDYGNFGSAVHYWSATEQAPSIAYYRNIYSSDRVGLERDNYYKYRGYSVRCLRDENTSSALPAVTTGNVYVLSSTSVTCGGNVTSEGSAAVTARGICWNTSHNPTTANAHTTNGMGTGSFNSTITGLSTNVTFYIRAYATSSFGTVYGEEVSCTIPINSNGDQYSCPGMPTLTDVDGNVYNTVKIGNQCWMRDNLRTSRYADGTAIGSYDWYYSGEDSSYVSTYGCLYKWSAVMHGAASTNSIPSGVQGVCPAGWHVPSDAEWTQLVDYVSGQGGDYLCGSSSTAIAKALASTMGWNSSSYDCAVGNMPDNNNATGFNAVPSGYRNDGFYYLGQISRFWSSTEYSSGYAYYRSLYYTSSYIDYRYAAKSNYYSVRCLRDSVSDETPSTTSCQTVKITPMAYNGSTEPYCPTYGLLTLAVIDSVTGNPIPNLTYTWSGESVNEASTDSTSYVVIVPEWCDTVYTAFVTVNDGQGCVKTVSRTIEVASSGPRFIGTLADTTVPRQSGCKCFIPDFRDLITTSIVIDDCYTLSNIKSTSFWYNQSPQAGTELTEESQIVTITITNPCGKSNTITVNVHKSADISAMVLSSTPDHFCNPTSERPGDGTITVIAPTSGSGHTYTYKIFDANDNELTVPYDFPTNLTCYWLSHYTYRVQAYESATGCSVSDTITVGHNPYSVDFSFMITPNTDCPSATGNGSIDVTNPTSTNPNPDFTYSIDGVHFSTVPVFTNLMDGTYSVYVKDATSECVAEKLAGIGLVDTIPPIISIDHPIRLYPVLGDDYSWNSPDSLTFVNAVVPYISDNCTDLSSLINSLEFLWENTTESPIGATGIFQNMNHRTITVIVTDGSGNSTETVAFYIDFPDAVPCSGTPTVIDIDGNTYNTVQIGGQCWMKENLRTTKYADGTSIPIGSSTSNISPYYYDYSTSGISLAERGYLYNWPAVMHGASSSSAYPSGVQGACPTGWHVPSYSEWTQLTDYVSSQNQYVCGNDSDFIAKALTAITGWTNCTYTCAVGNNPSDNNATGFGALPAGYYSNGYYGSGNNSTFWIATEASSGTAFTCGMDFDGYYVSRISDDKSYGFSVRCLRDIDCIPSTSEFSATSCDTYTWNGQIYSQSGDYTQTFTNAMGCDSVVTMHLTINLAPDPPEISITNQTVCNGGQVTLQVTNPVAGAVYIWYRDGVVIPGATQATFSESPLVVDGDATNFVYNVVAALPMSGCISESSDNAIVYVIPAPVATVSVDGNTTFCQDGNTTLNVNVTPAAAYTYQWYKDNVIIANATNADFVVNEVARETAYNFKVVVTANAGCSVPAAAPAITVVADPVVSATISNDIACVGGTTTLTAVVEGGIDGISYTYQWYRNTPNSTAQIVATGATHITDGSETSDNYTYWVVVNSAYGCNALSSPVSFSVIADPQVSIAVHDWYSTSTVVCERGETMLNANVIGGYGGASYQWYKNGTVLAGETNQNLALNNLAYGVNDTYTVEVTQSGVGCSNNASSAINNLVTVAPAYTVDVTGFGNVCEGGTLTLTATVNNVVVGDILSYQWHRIMNGQDYPIAGANGATYSTSDFSLGNSYEYFVVVNSNISGCSAVSSVVPAYVVAAPSVTIQGANTICEGGNLTLNAFVTGGVAGTDYIYTWNWTGAATGTAVTADPTFVPTFAANDVATPYYVTVTISRTDNTGCTATSAAHEVNVLAVPTVSITADNAYVCQNGEVTLTAHVSPAGYYNYVWTINGQQQAVNAATITTSMATVGAINATVVVSAANASASCSATATLAAPVQVVAAPSVTIAADHTTMCVGGTTTLTANVAVNGNIPADFSYQWAINGIEVDGAVANTFVQPLNAAGVYTYTLRVSQNNNLGCNSTWSAPVTVQVAEQPVVALSSVDGLNICEGGSITLTGTVTNYGNTVNGVTNSNIYGAMTFDWTRNGANVHQDANVNTAMKQFTETLNTIGNYSYQVSVDAAGFNCLPQVSNVQTVNVVGNPSITVQSSASILYGESITLTASGASAYSWSTGANTASIMVSPISTTTYTVTGTSSYGCTATASKTVTVSAVIDEKSCPNTPTVTDHEGNVYATVQIGDQCWMRENLRTTKYADGAGIEQGSGGSETIGYWYYPNYDSVNKQTYGLLYNWAAVMRGMPSVNTNPSGVQGPCPIGWHVPSDVEWIQLINYVGDQSIYGCNGNAWSIAKAMSSVTGWNNSSVICSAGNDQSTNNATGFSVVPAGCFRVGYGSRFGESAYLWSTTEYDSTETYGGYIDIDIIFMPRVTNLFKDAGLSVRCLRDESGAVIDDKSCPTTPTVTDHEGNVYATVQIGDQCWMRDNLRTTTSPCTGTYLIPSPSTGYTYTGKQARWYNNDSATYAPMNYGLLYNWNAAVDTFNTAYGETSVNISSSNAVSVSFTGHRRGICPVGWHLPSNAEWTQLTNYVKSQNEYVCGTNSNSIAKALADSVGWNSYIGTCCVGNNQSTNNATGFSAVPAGLHYGSSFLDSGSSANFWSSTEYSSSYAYYRYLVYNLAGVTSNYGRKSYGYSVRCLRD